MEFTEKMESLSPLVSIIMPAFNVEQFVAQAIQSILDQSEQNWELLICDDASSDRTVEIISNFQDPRIKFFKNDTNKGNLATSLFLCAQAKGKYYTLQDADDYSHRDRIKMQSEAMEKDAELGMVGVFYEMIAEDGTPIRSSFYPLENTEIKEIMKDDAPPMHCCVMVRRSLIDDVGYYRNFFDRIGAADYDWMYRIAEKTKVANIGKVLFYYRHNPNSFTQTNQQNLLKLHTESVALFLAQQRAKEGGTDAITRNSEKEIYGYLAKLFVEISSNHYWNDRKEKALAYAKWAIKFKPFSSTAWRHYLYLLRN